MSNSPLVSVIVPCYNYAKYLPESIGSLQAQTYSNWEMIVVDDASPIGDAAGEAAKIGDPRVTVIRHEKNSGAGVSRNTAIKVSKGDLLLPLDCDDLLAPTCLEKLVGLITGPAGYNVVFPDLLFFGETDRLVRLHVLTTRDMLINQWIPGGGALFRKELWAAAGGYRTELPAEDEDWDFWLSAAEQGIKAGHVPEPLYLYRQHTGSRAAFLRKIDSRSRELMYQRHKAMFDRYKMGRRFRADGYRVSANYAWQDGQRRRAAQLALQGLLITPQPFVLAGLRTIYRSARNILRLNK